MTDVTSPLQGTIVRVEVGEGDLVRAGQQAVVIESMKMEHVVAPEVSGIVRRVVVAVGDTVLPGQALLVVEESDVDIAGDETEQARDLDAVRPDLAEVLARQAVGRDDARPAAVARRRESGQRTALSESLPPPMMLLANGRGREVWEGVPATQSPRWLPCLCCWAW